MRNICRIFGRLLFVSVFFATGLQLLGQTGKDKVVFAQEFPEVNAVSLGGMLGEAVLASEHGRIKSLPEWENGQLITMFSVQSRQTNKKMDWYGEHGGKWLYMAAKAAARTGDKEIKELLIKTADYLVDTQEEDGYLGTYSVDQRMTSDAPSTHKWSWDVWNLSYMVMGLLEVYHYYPNEKYLDAAKKIGELFLDTFGDGRRNLTNYGTNHGISATIILDPVVELYKTTGDSRFLQFAELIIKEIEAREEFRLISGSLRKIDLEKVAQGKAYQLCWNLFSVAKLYEVTGNPDYLQAVKNAWQNIVDEHLTITGGPWGGIGKHYETFNRKGYWSPYGFVETCSTMSWMDLNRELLGITGDTKYAEQLEKSAYNALLGARYPDGDNWCYHSFTNGCRHEAEYDDCCPSSGTIALEEISHVIFGSKAGGIACNLYSSAKAEILLTGSNKVQVEQKTSYPHDGKVSISIHPQKPAEFPLFFRIPEWAKSHSVSVNNRPIEVPIDENGYGKVERLWKGGDQVLLDFPMDIVVHHKTEQIPKYDKVISAIDWFALSRGPLVYAVDGLLFGKERESVIDLPLNQVQSHIRIIEPDNAGKAPELQLLLPDNRSLRFLPFYQADNSEPGAWRLTWLQKNIR